MAKIITRAGLTVGTELIIDEPNRTFQLVAAGNLVAKDGVTVQALYSKLVDLWATVTYQNSPFPMNALDVLSGQYQIGVDAGGNANGWKPLDVATRQMMRDGGWEEYDSTGALLRVYAGIVGLGSVSAGAQVYYQAAPADAPTNFTFTDQVNEAIQVFGDVANGNFDKRVFFKGYVREQGKMFGDSALADTGKTGTGANIVNLLLSNQNDFKITALDAAMVNAPYSTITVEYFTTDQTRIIGGVAYPFRVIVAGNGATLEQIYTKIQYLLRQNTDIDNGVGSVIGQTANQLMGFIGNTLKTTLGVFIDGVASADINRVEFLDQTGATRTNPFVALGALSFNDNLINDPNAQYWMYFTNPTGAVGDEYGSAGAIIVNDNAGLPISGTVGGLASIAFDFDYDGNVQGGRTPATDANVTVVALGLTTGQYVSATGTLTRTNANQISLVSSLERNYNNPI